MDIHKRIDDLRKKKGWSFSKLAKEAGLSETTVYDWYNENHYTPSRRAIEDVCEALEITLSEFYCDVDVDKLNEQQMLLLDLFSKVPDKKKETVIALVKSFTE